MAAGDCQRGGAADGAAEDNEKKGTTLRGFQTDGVTQLQRGP